ncbi:MAG: hypothetical protein AAFV71_04550 [Cyanobacteria bacterium J06633_8]
MSYQFTFLQAFAGYDFAKGGFLASLNRNPLLQSLYVCLSVDFYRQAEIMLLADRRKDSTRICYWLKFFRQMSLDRAATEYGALLRICLYTIGDRFKALQNQYSRHLGKYLEESSSDCDRSYIFNNYIAIFLCKYLLRLGFSKNKKSPCGILLS